MPVVNEITIINSALWAAVGDAIGWISELADEDTLKRRVKNTFLHMPVSWTRKIGGMFGASVQLPAGTYSDDTQLRLAVGRAIRGNGYFDIESFAKIELPVWQSYALGAGRATKQAASNLIKKDVTWFSNFYSGKSEYVLAGGNGTAMRIQPHVWSCKNLSSRAYVSSVIKDTIVTHGSMTAICGAVLHADLLQYAMLNKKPASIAEIRKLVDYWFDISNVINDDYELFNFWLPTWEQLSKSTVANEIEYLQREVFDLLSKIEDVLDTQSDNRMCYKSIIQILDGKNPARRGSAINTTLASAMLCYLYFKEDIYEAILTAVNELGTDTDTIATMAGAIIGAYCTEAPKWDVQDKDYIVSESRRLYAISRGTSDNEFKYPNLMTWSPPQSQIDTLVINNGKLYVSGLGEVFLLNSDEWSSRGFSWRWGRLAFGQSLLIKSKAEALNKFSLNSHEQVHYPEVKGVKSLVNMVGAVDLDSVSNEEPILDLDKITSQIIKNGFQHEEVGRFLMGFIDQYGIEMSVAYSSIVAKAYLARRKR